MKQLSTIACIAPLAGVFLCTLPCVAQQQKTGHKPIPVAVKVEAEGEGKGQGMWLQEAKDLTPAEAKTLESLVVAELKKQEGVKIVPVNNSEDLIGVVVVGAKLPNGKTGKSYYIATVFLISKKEGTDEFGTHDVIAAVDLASLARNIAFLFANARFKIAVGQWK